VVHSAIFWSGLGWASPVLAAWLLFPLITPIWFLVRMARKQPVSSESIIYATAVALPYAAPPAFLSGPLVLVSVLFLLSCPVASFLVLLKPGCEMAQRGWSVVLLLPHVLGIALYLVFGMGAFLS
jgi:hypothetical protein